MNEKLRTIIHIAVAAVVALLVSFEVGGSYFTKKAATGPGGLINKPLFENFKDPLAAKSLEITKFDEKLAQMKSFKVAEVKGRWAIPSQNNYPADAQDRLRDVSTTLLDLKPIDYASEVPEDHQELGVVEPIKGQTKAGDQGLGTLITVQDAKGDDLFKLIVGKEVAGTGDQPSGQRFVRKPGEDVVWVAAIDMSKLPTEFDQWIEKDLLKLNALDVAKVTLKDYNVLPSSEGRYGIFPRMDAHIVWNSEKGEWQLEQLLRFTQNKPVSDGLGEQEELNKTKLDELKTALDDLKIVNVQRKPPGIDAELKLSQALVSNREGLLSLQELGFYPTAPKGEKLELASANGEVIIDMKDGVQYLLRFGNVASDVAGVADGKLNRYLFVSAQLAPDVLTPPKLEAEPASPAGPEPSPPKPTTPAAPGSTEEKKSGGGGAEQATDEKKTTEQPEPQAKQPENTAQQPDNTVKQPENTAKQPDNTVKQPVIGADPVKPGPPPVIDPTKAAADKIRKENRRKMEDWEDRKKKATTRVTELNARFADWYYVISEDVYKKIHLSRADIIKEATAAKDEGFGIDAFRKLESDGIKQTIPSTPPGGARPGGFNPDTFNPGGFDR